MAEEPAPGSARYTRHLLGNTLRFFLRNVVTNPPSPETIKSKGIKIASIGFLGLIGYTAYTKYMVFEEVGDDCKSLLKLRGEEVPKRKW